MMFYFYTIIIPLLILLTNYCVVSPRPKKAFEYIKLFMRALPHEIGYMFFLYYIEREYDIHTGGAALGMFIFLIPITAIILLLYVFYWFKNKQRSGN